MLDLLCRQSRLCITAFTLAAGTLTAPLLHAQSATTPASVAPAPPTIDPLRAPILRCPAPTSVASARPHSSTAATVASSANDSPIQLTSDAAQLGVDGNALLKGHVRISQGERQLSADEVEYNAAKSAFKVRGSVEYQDPVLHASGRSGSYGQSTGASFAGATFELPERPARGTAEAMSFDTNGVATLNNVTFSTCPADDPAWRIRARSIVLDTKARNGVGRNATVEFKGVPILYLPWMSFPLGSERKSGFLFPNIGHTSRSGFQFTMPWYWNIAPQYDLTLEPAIYSDRGFNLAAEFRYLLSTQKGRLAVDVLPHDALADFGGQTNRNRSRVHLDHLAELPQGWRVKINAENVSDTFWYEDFAQGPEGTSAAFVKRLGEVTYRDAHWRLRGEVQQFQTIDAALPGSDHPYARLPGLEARGDWKLGRAGALAWGFDSELVNFRRNNGVQGWRADVAPRVGLDIDGAGYFLRPAAGLRYTRYALSDTAPGANNSLQRSLPFAMLDAGLTFERAAGARGQRRVTLEPRLLYLYTPFRDQSALPVFDSALPDLNLVQLFSSNRYVGADRVSDANQLSAGLTTRLFSSSSGAQFLSATIGQTLYFTTPRVRLPDEPVQSRHSSDLIAQVALTGYKNWNLDLGLQWNPKASQSERSQLRLQYRPDTEHVLNFAYRFQRNRIEQAEVSGAWPIAKRWNLFARVVYDLTDATALERFTGVEYKACCWRVRAVARRFVSSRTGERDTGLYLQLELNGLASVGVPADAFLENAIRGYSALAANR